MSRIIYDADAMKFMSSFEFITKSKVKDFVAGDNFLLFIVPKGFARRAVGPNGSNVRRMEKVFKKKVKVVEFASEPVSFIKNLVYPLKVTDVIKEDGVFTLVPVDSRTRSILIGKNACNLRFYESVVKRFFPITELKVGKQNGK